MVSLIIIIIIIIIIISCQLLKKQALGPQTADS
jgi:hypothetical protein